MCFTSFLSFLGRRGALRLLLLRAESSSTMSLAFLLNISSELQIGPCSYPSPGDNVGGDDDEDEADPALTLEVVDSDPGEEPNGQVVAIPRFLGKHLQPHQVRHAVGCLGGLGFPIAARRKLVLGGEGDPE